MGGVPRGHRGGEGPPARRVVLDTDVFSYLFDGRPEAARFLPLPAEDVAVAFPTVAELHFGASYGRWGAARIRDLEREIGEIGLLLPDDELVRLCGELRADASRLGHPLGHKAHANDLWIATCAVHYGAPLVTGNVRHFEGLPGLTVVPPHVAR